MPKSTKSALDCAQTSLAHQSSQKAIAPGQEVQHVSHDEEDMQKTSDNENGKIVVNVWASAESNPKQPDPAALSRGFALAALTTARKLQFTEHRIANSVKNGFPLGEFWIQTDFDSIDESLSLATLSAENDADRRALQQLQTQRQHLRLWSDWLIDQNRRMALADYYTSPARLDNDERFQSTVGCTNFLLSMLASGRTAENSYCY